MVVLPSSKTNHVRSGKKIFSQWTIYQISLEYSFFYKKDNLHLFYVAVGQSIRKYTMYTRCWHGAWHMLRFDDAIPPLDSSVLQFPSFSDLDLPKIYYFLLV